MGLLQELDNARRVAGRNLQDLFSDPSAYAERLTDRLRNMNAGVTPIATPTELTNRPQTLEERVEDWSGRLDPGSGMMGVIKPRGGNWLSSRFGPEAQLKALKKYSENAPEDIAKREANLATPVGQVAPNGILMTQELQDRIANEHQMFAKHAALNTWVDNQLTKYIKNDMAAPTDPIRKLADAWPEEKAQKLALAEARVAKLRQKQQAQAATRGVPEEYLTQTRQDILAAEEARDLIAENVGLHYTPQASDVFGESYMRQMRDLAGMPVKPVAKNPLAKSWEDLADYSINVRPAKEYQLPRNLQQDPWLAKVDPNVPVYSLGYDIGYFRHLTDELTNSLREGRITPEQLAKMPVDQAVRHVAEINALRKVNAAKQQAMDASEIPVFKDYPEQGLSWRQLKSDDPKKLRKWLTQEGDAMGHCVGGYCGDVASGASNIYSLRDAKGKPYVTIETTGGRVDPNGNGDDQAMVDALWDQAALKFGADAEGTEPFMQFIEDGINRLNAQRLEMINQIKGPGNRSPDPKYFPLIQDFIRQGKWSAIEDAQNAGLTRQDVAKLLGEQN